MRKSRGMAEHGRKSAWGWMVSQAPSIIVSLLAWKAFVVPTAERKFILREQVLSIEIIVPTACIASMWMRSRETGKLLVMDKWSPSG
jgi:hypothetical protein